MERKETLARIRIPLSEGADTEANLKNNAYINLIASYKQDKKLPYRSDLRLNISIDGLIFKGPIKKQDFKRLMDFLLLFGSDLTGLLLSFKYLIASYTNL
jgi:hypothetical protein